MLTRRRCAAGSILALAATAATLMVFYVTGALAASSPADKVVAAGDSDVIMAPQQGEVILTAFMKTSKPTDLVLNVSLECSIVTTVTATGGGLQTDDAFGRVRVWVEVDDQIVPIQSISEPPQNTPPAGVKATDSVVFCERLHRITTMNMNSDESHEHHQLTKNANAFNWLRFNVGAASHKIEVVADLETSAELNPLNAQAVVGNRTLVVTPTKMANDAVINNPGTG